MAHITAHKERAEGVSKTYIHLKTDLSLVGNVFFVLCIYIHELNLCAHLCRFVQTKLAASSHFRICLLHEKKKFKAWKTLNKNDDMLSEMVYVSFALPTVLGSFVQNGLQCGMNCVVWGFGFLLPCIIKFSVVKKF